MHPIIRAKMFVNTVSEHKYAGSTNSQEQVKLGVVYSDKADSPNKAWAQATPSGHMELTIDNPGAQGKLKPGQYFYVDLIPCEKDSP